MSWRLTNEHHQHSVTDGTRTLFATQWKYGGPSEAEREAMQLAAMAPDLLAVLQKLVAIKPCRIWFADEAEAERYFQAVARAEMMMGKAIVQSNQFDTQPIADTMNTAIQKLEKLLK